MYSKYDRTFLNCCFKVIIFKTQKKNLSPADKRNWMHKISKHQHTKLSITNNTCETDNMIKNDVVRNNSHYDYKIIKIYIRRIRIVSTIKAYSNHYLQMANYLFIYH